MFEKIVLRRSEDGAQPTLGEIAEALLFYQHIHLILDRASVIFLGQKLGIESLLLLLDRGDVSATYCRDELATQTTRIGALQHHLFTSIELVGKDGSSRKYSVVDVVTESIKQTGSYSNRQATRLAEKLLEKAPVKTLSGKDFLGRQGIGLMEAATADVYDSSYALEALSRILSVTQGFNGFSSNLTLEVHPTHKGFTVFSNLDLTSINQARAQMSSLIAPLDMAHFMNQILMARSDMLLAAHYGSDFRTSREASSLIGLKYEELLKRSNIHAEEKDQFQKLVVSQGRTLKECIDSGDRTFAEFLLLLDKAKNFREWTAGIHPDASMVATYFEEKSREGWVGGLPAKLLRFVIGGTLDGGTGVAYGLADTFLLEKFAKGWRPNHFVEGRLKTFVSG